jgi:hypothetical protein
MNRLLSKQYKESMVMEFGREMSVLEAKMWDEKVLVLLRPVLSVESENALIGGEARLILTTLS